MDAMRREGDRAVRIRRLMDEFGLPEDEAIFAVDLADGTHAGDIVGLTAEERRRIGLDHPIDDLAGDRSAPASVGVSSGTGGSRER